MVIKLILFLEHEICSVAAAMLVMPFYGDFERS